jgi:hypothetical protein
LQRWLERCQENQMMEKIKNNERNHHDINGGRSSGCQGNNGRGGHGGCGRGQVGHDGRGSNNSEHLKTVDFFNSGKQGHYSTDCSIPRKNDNENSNMVSKADFKNLFQSSLKDMLTKKDKQAKKKDNMEVDDESLDMNVLKNSWKVSTHIL